LTERMVVRSEALITRIAMDPHSPSEFRVNGIVRNMNAWYDAFGVTEGDELYLAPEERVSIW
ncbi:MAG: M13-type metalloendopeptidase, partial [Demequina sp.]